MEDEIDEDGLWGIDEDGLDEADSNDVEFEDVTDIYGDDLNKLTPDTGINEEILLVNDDLDFDRNEFGMHSGKLVFNDEASLPSKEEIINTPYGRIVCTGRCETCRYISICTKAVDRYINNISDLSEIPPMPRRGRRAVAYRRGAHLPPRMYRHRYLTDIGATKRRKAKCKKGYKLMRSKKTGKLKCVRAKKKTTKVRVPSTFGAKSKSPFAPLLIFPKTYRKSGKTYRHTGWKRSAASIGNFVFVVAVLAGLAWVAPKMVEPVKKSVDYGIDSYKRFKETKLIGKR